VDLRGRVDGANEVTTGGGDCRCSVGRDIGLIAPDASVGISVFNDGAVEAWLGACVGRNASLETLPPGVSELGAEDGRLLESAVAAVPIGKTKKWDCVVTL
jgi:hypothetical protein